MTTTHTAPVLLDRTRHALDVSVPEGYEDYEVPEVSAAKDEVQAIVRDLLEYHGLDLGVVQDTPRDPIGEADQIVEQLLTLGWRPTTTTAQEA